MTTLRSGNAKAAAAAAGAATPGAATPGGATPGAGNVVARPATIGTTAEPAVQSGEHLVSSAFFEGGEHTVTLTPGAGMVALRGADDGSIAATPAPASDGSSDDESADSSASSSISDPLVSASEGSEDSDMPSLEESGSSSSSEDEDESKLAPHVSFKGWARPKPAASARSGRIVETREPAEPLDAVGPYLASPLDSSSPYLSAPAAQSNVGDDFEQFQINTLAQRCIGLHRPGRPGVAEEVPEHRRRAALLLDADSAGHRLLRRLPLSGNG